MRRITLAGDPKDDRDSILALAMRQPRGTWHRVRWDSRRGEPGAGNQLRIRENIAFRLLWSNRWIGFKELDANEMREILIEADRITDEWAADLIGMVFIPEGGASPANPSARLWREDVPQYLESFADSCKGIIVYFGEFGVRTIVAHDDHTAIVGSFA